MALVDNAWYINYGNGSSTGWWAVTAWTTGAVIAAGALRRQTAPTALNERVFVCIVAGTTHATTEPTWVLTRGAKTTDNTVTWQECSGIAALNGDATNTPTWTITATPPGGVKGTAVTLGQVIKRDSGASYQICTTAGTAGSGAEPAFSDTAGTTTADNTITWTSLGVVGNFTGWQAPHARVGNAQASTWGQNGNKFYVNSASVETGTAQNYNVGIQSAPVYVLCVGTGNVPPTSADVTTGASIAITGGSAGFGTNDSVVQIWDGISLSCSAGTAMRLSGSGNSCVFKFSNATIATTSAHINLGALAGQSASALILDNVAFSFSNTLQSLDILFCRLTWKNSGAAGLAGAAVPTTLFTDPASNSKALTALIEGVDLSAAGVGKTLFSGTSAAGYDVALVGCKINASVTLGQPGMAGDLSLIDIINCDSGAVNYRNERWSYAGAKTTETTIVRTGGASNGTITISNKIVTTANVLWALPFNDNPIAIWNDSTSSVTVTLFGIWGGGAVPNNDDFWIDVDYLGSALTPVASRTTSGKANILTAATPLTSDTSSWGGSTTAFKTSVTFTPGMKGYIYVTPKMAKLSTTLYYDPKLSVT